MPDPTDSPTGRVDELFGAVADAVGAERPAPITAGLSDAERSALDRIMRAVGWARLTHTLNTSGDVLVPIGNGEWTIVLSHITLDGDDWVSAEIPLAFDMPERSQLPPETDARIQGLVDETNLYYAAKCLRIDDTVVLMTQLPVDGLTGAALLRALRRLAWILAEIADDVAALPGKRLPSVWRDRLGITRSVSPDPLGVRDYDA